VIVAFRLFLWLLRGPVKKRKSRCYQYIYNDIKPPDSSAEGAWVGQVLPRPPRQPFFAHRSGYSRHRRHQSHRRHRPEFAEDLRPSGGRVRFSGPEVEPSRGGGREETAPIQPFRRCCPWLVDSCIGEVGIRVGYYWKLAKVGVRDSKYATLWEGGNMLMGAMATEGLSASIVHNDIFFYCFSKTGRFHNVASVTNNMR
jgi:hypothetical protein